MKKNYTILIDSRFASTHVQDVQKIRQEAQKIAMSKKLLISAEIVSPNAITNFQSDSMSKITKLPKGKFSTWKEAENWLNKQAEEA